MYQFQNCIKSVRRFIPKGFLKCSKTFGNKILFSRNYFFLRVEIPIYKKPQNTFDTLLLYQKCSEASFRRVPKGSNTNLETLLK